MTLRSLVPCLPEPNHLRLISDCYPKSKTATSPESNALGKLSFYSQARPVKLAKVGKALLRRSQRHGETLQGLCITLAIVKKLLDGGRKDVSVFGDEAMGIIEAGLQKAGSSSDSTSDEHSVLELYEKAASTFYALATFSQPSAIDERQYLSLLRQFCQLATSNRSIQSRIVGLHALEGVVQSELFQSADFKAQNELVIPALLHVIVEAGWDGSRLDEHPDSEGKTKESSSQQEQRQYARPALHERRARSIRIAKGMQGTEKPPSSIDAAQHAYKVLCQLFRLAQPRHLEAAMEETVRFLDTYENGKAWKEREWCVWLVGKYMEWTQTQYRFEIIRFWLDQLQAIPSTNAVGEKHSTTLAILIHLLSSPNMAVVNLAVGDVLETLSNLVARNPEDPGLRKAIAALSTHIYYPEQINDLVGDLLTDATELYVSGAQNPQAIVSLLECARGMVVSSIGRHGKSDFKGKGVARQLNLEQLPSTLILLEAREAITRTSYLQTIATILQAQAVTSNDDIESRRPETAKTVPSITFSNSTKAGIPLHPSQNARFAKDLQLRLYSIFESNTGDLNAQETEAISSALEAIYAGREGQTVLDGVPVLLAWKTAAGQSTETQMIVAKLLSDASRVLAKTWDVSLIQDSGAFVYHLSSSKALQDATAMSQHELFTALCQPYVHSPLSPNSPMETLASPNRRSRSVRSSKYGRDHHGTNGAGGAETRSLQGKSSIHNISLADLKQSLGQTPQSGNTSPGRSTVNRGDRSIASSYIASTPPNGAANGTTGRVDGGRNSITGSMTNSGVHLSPTDSVHQSHRRHNTNGSSGSPTSKKRLDRIVGSLEEPRKSSEIPNPPYQLT